MNSAVLAPQLKALGLIPETVESKVLQSKNKKDANAHLLNHLKADADEESVTEVFRIASKEEGYGRMKAFAASMLRKLQQGLYCTQMLLVCTPLFTCVTYVSVASRKLQISAYHRYWKMTSVNWPHSKECKVALNNIATDFK